MSIFLHDAKYMNPTEEIAVLWSEINCLIDAISNLAGPPPSYHMQDEPPSYVFSVQRDLDSLLAAVDRLSCVAPPLNDQRAELTERQANDLAAATVLKSMERLSRGSMNSQRAEMLNDLVARIYDNASRHSLDNQRVALNPRLQQKKEIANVTGLVSRSDHRRIINEDGATNNCISLEPRLSQELCHMTELLFKSLDQSLYNKQRYTMSSMKERLVGWKKDE
ncbi:hypothetical protein DFQ28_010751 [Apophysomyces sp. BC1034]|nr:hypothetical protein DFQ29_009230 [Apophysomyces sp. BC1021]KAG0184669.1 hypothetical protein DFQ28_010751 [Apophysomyces sp. BC1034]